MEKVRNAFAGILYPPGVTRLDCRVSTVLVLILFSTQLTLTTPFSYLPAMVKSFGYKDEDRGYYAGIIASSLFVGRFVGGYFWGYTTDKFGRRPVMLMSAVLTYIATLMFGFTTNIYFAIFSRFLQGLFNGVIVCGRAAFSEICDDTNQAIGVSLVFAAWNSAIVLGPAIGGFLADPVQKYPKAFDYEPVGTFFRKFRFLLPNIFISSLLLISIIGVYFFFKETLDLTPKTPEDMKAILEEEESVEFDADKHEKVESSEKATKGVKTKAVKEGEEPDCLLSFLCRKISETTLWSFIRDPTVCLSVGLFGLSGFIIIGFQELTSLWMATGLGLGGLNFTTNQIGTALLVPALVSVIFQPILFSRLERRFGAINTMRACLVVLIVATCLFGDIHEAHKNTKLLWALLIGVRIFRMTADVSTRSALAMFVNNSVFANKAGSVNGYAFSVQEVMRAFSPTLVGSMFAWAVSTGRKKIGFPMDYHLPFYFLGFLIVILFSLSFLLPRSINLPKRGPKVDA